MELFYSSGASALVVEQVVHLSECQWFVHGYSSSHTSLDKILNSNLFLCDCVLVRMTANEQVSLVIEATAISV